jgi:predicted phage gp36 major capsid-like protein
MAIQVVESLSATGAGSPVSGSGPVDISLSGTWVGTVTAQRQIGGSWRDVQSYTQNGEFVMENATALSVRLNFTRTSGTVDTVLATSI